jgi:putative membrane protein
MKNTNTVSAIVVIAVLAVLLLGGVGMMGFGGFGMMGPGMMGGYGGPYAIGYNPLGAILSLVLWALVIAGIVLLVVWLVRSGHWTGPASGPDSAMEILKARYARGEVTKDQFDAMKRDLQ